MEDENTDVRDCKDWYPDKKHNCIINIFCCDKGHNCESDHKKDDDNCIINIFCDGRKSKDKIYVKSLDD